MTNFNDELRDLNLRMLEQAQEEIFRADQGAVGIAQHGRKRNAILRAARDEQRRLLAEARGYVYDMAVDAGLLPRPVPQQQHSLPPVEDEPFEAPRYLNKHNAYADLDDVVMQ